MTFARFVATNFLTLLAYVDPHTFLFCDDVITNYRKYDTLVQKNMCFQVKYSFYFVR